MRARAISAERTGQQVITAAYELILVEHYDDVTLANIATKAGVTVQTVLRRFGSKEGVYEAVFTATTHGVNELRSGVPPGDAAQLVATVVSQYEFDGDAIIRLLAVEDRVAAVRAQMDRNRKSHREWLAHLFADSLPDPGPARKRTLAKIVAASDVYTWKLLRRDMSMSATQTRTTMTELLEAALETPKGDV